MDRANTKAAGIKSLYELSLPRENPKPNPTKQVIRGNVRKTVNARRSADIQRMMSSSNKSDKQLKANSSAAIRLELLVSVKVSGLSGDRSANQSYRDWAYVAEQAFAFPLANRFANISAAFLHSSSVLRRPAEMRAEPRAI